MSYGPFGPDPVLPPIGEIAVGRLGDRDTVPVMKRLARAPFTLAILAICAGCTTGAPMSSRGVTVPGPQFFAISAADAKVTAGWYVEAFGLEIIEESTSPDGTVGVVNIGNERVRIEIIEHPEAKNRQELGIARGYDVHGVFKVGFFVEDIEAEIARLEALGVTFRGRLVEFPSHGVRTILVNDPEGNIVQLFEWLP